MRRSIIAASYVIGSLAVYAASAEPAAAVDDAAYPRFGVAVSADGHILAPNWVIDDCASVASPTSGPLQVIDTHPELDLALLQAQGGLPAYAKLGKADTVEPGALRIAALPAPGGTATGDLVQASGRMVAVSTSMRNALFMSVEIAAPHAANAVLVLDPFGGVFAIVTGSVTPRSWAHSDWTLWAPLPKDKALKRNAVGEAMLRQFLDHQHVDYVDAPAGAALPEQAAIEQLSGAVMLIECRQ